MFYRARYGCQVTYTHSASVEYSGFTIIVAASTETPKEARSGDGATYRLAMTPNDGFLADGPMEWEFSGQIEKTIVVDALRELADQLASL